MSIKNIFVLLLLLPLGCASVKDYGRAYFNGSDFQGVEPVELLLERMATDQKLRDVTYGQAKSAAIVQCTLLRNQLYVAALKGAKAKEIIDAVRLMEHAYQDNDDAFLKACAEVKSTPVGQNFMALQEEYLRSRPQ